MIVTNKKVEDRYRILIKKGLQRCCALQPRHLQQLIGNAGQGCHEQDHIISKILPQKQDYDNNDGIAGLQPVNLLYAEDSQKIIDCTVIMEQYLPDQHDGGYRYHHGA